LDVDYVSDDGGATLQQRQGSEQRQWR
jgi:hypothetical protein